MISAMKVKLDYSSRLMIVWLETYWTFIFAIKEASLNIL